jgi:chaperone modulatory protein CbpM
MRLDETAVVTSISRLSVRQLRTWVRRGWIRHDQESTGSSFTEIDIARIRLVCHLRADLNVNDDSIPVILSLLDQLYGVRRELRLMAEAVARQPEAVQQDIAEAVARISDRSELQSE